MFTEPQIVTGSGRKPMKISDWLLSPLVCPRKRGPIVLCWFMLVSSWSWLVFLAASGRALAKVCSPCHERQGSSLPAIASPSFLFGHVLHQPMLTVRPNGNANRKIKSVQKTSEHCNDKCGFKSGICKHWWLSSTYRGTWENWVHFWCSRSCLLGQCHVEKQR